MMSVAVGLTRWWVALYTAGLASDARDERRAEIESDLYEHGSLNGGNGVGERTTAIEVLVRLLLGAPADLSWRLAQRRAAPRERRTIEGSKTMIQRLSGPGLTLLALLLAAFFIIPSSLVLFHVGGDLTTGERYVFGTLGVVAGVVMLSGLLLSNRSPWLAAGLLSLAAVGMAVLWFWLFFILVPVALVVIGLAVVRARRSGAGNTPAPLG